MYPNLCERPKKAEEYCLKHPQFCPKNISALVIPKHGYYTTFSKEVSEVSQQLLINRSKDIVFSTSGSKPTVSFINVGSTEFAKCYSENLHLYQSRLEGRVEEVDAESPFRYGIYYYYLRLYEEESFIPWGQPQAFFAIHSPFNPINPVHYGHAIRSGFTYRIEVKLEEDHLLPPPYATNCKDYNIRLENLNEIKPRSQQMCQELCRSEYYKQCYGCDLGITMQFTSEYFCRKGRSLGLCDHSALTESELSQIRHTCLKGCRPDCIKLKYPYTVKETENERSLETGFKDQNARILVVLRNLDVKIMSHEPFYAESELFSYIGGLVGCWLGISVFTFTDVFEKFVKMVVVLKGNYRRRRDQTKIRNRKTEKGITGKRKKEKRSRKSPCDVKEV
ncbi:hypothetical protein AVEN_266120-1 [Araneus ventricosus]|uniref:Uncharacterized protein n=1 Tax=Araneus ventricosus TaxID=182803 RepID=A0A4Y2M5V7_ARAVE|nr:hypothetical protein AVEN_266120-1 [Araneus ventricosus]